MHADVTEAHRWLDRLAGDWVLVPEPAAEGAESGCPSQGGWTEQARSLGGLWLVSEGRGSMPDGAPASTLLTLGYDPARERYVGTWTGSMMAHLWIYEGTLDESGQVLTLDTEGPNFMDGNRMARFQDIVAFEDADTRTLTARVQGENGEWRTFMRARYRRA